MFTFLSKHAFQLEIAESLETDSFLSAVRRFLERRGS